MGSSQIDMGLKTPRGIDGPSGPTGVLYIGGVLGRAPAGCGAEPREEKIDPYGTIVSITCQTSATLKTATMEPVGSALPEAPAPAPNGRVLDEGVSPLPLDAASMGGACKLFANEFLQQACVGTGSVIFGVAAHVRRCEWSVCE